MHPWSFFWQKIQNTTCLQIGAWNLYSRVFWYAESDGMIFIKILWLFWGDSTFFRKSGNFLRSIRLFYSCKRMENLISKMEGMFYLTAKGLVWNLQGVLLGGAAFLWSSQKNTRHGLFVLCLSSKRLHCWFRIKVKVKILFTRLLKYTRHIRPKNGAKNKIPYIPCLFYGVVQD